MLLTNTRQNVCGNGIIGVCLDILYKRIKTLDYKERKLVERAAKKKRIAMGQASIKKCIAYAVPVINDKELDGVLLIVRGSEMAEQLLNIDVFSHAGVTMLVDHQHDIRDGQYG